jgi:hypothetical protein
LINEDSFFLVKEWKAGKRRAERDDLVGAAFFLTVQSPQGLVLEDRLLSSFLFVTMSQNLFPLVLK